MMEILNEAHRAFANMIGLYALIVGAWGLFNFIRRQPPDGNYNGALVIAVIIIALEGLTGFILFLLGFRAGRSIHFLYGVTMLLTVPAIYAFTRGSNTTRESMLYGLGLIFIWGLSERASETGFGG
jgi:CDP-diglyceride synthetase